MIEITIKNVLKHLAKRMKLKDKEYELRNGHIYIETEDKKIIPKVCNQRLRWTFNLKHYQKVDRFDNYYLVRHVKTGHYEIYELEKAKIDAVPKHFSESGRTFQIDVRELKEVLKLK